MHNCIKSTMVKLLSEIPPDTIVYNILGEYSFTASDLISKIDEEIGEQFTSDFLRICRNFLIAKVRRNVRN